MFENYFKKSYQRTMNEAYGLAAREIFQTLNDGGNCLDCGDHSGSWYDRLAQEIGLEKEQYHGIEWNKKSVEEAQKKGLHVQHGDLNNNIPFNDNSIKCIFALSLLEHLLNGCHYLQECYRTLKKDGKLIILTPNISTYFTAALILAGKMPSSGPYPDSRILMRKEQFVQVRSENIHNANESDILEDRHLIVFSFRVLRKYLAMIGFSEVRGYGFGLYPFPNFMQPVLEKIDPYHCHQMVFIAKK